MNAEEMKTLSVEQLKDAIQDWKKELFALSVKLNREKKAEKPHMFVLLKKQIARAKTFIRQNELSKA